MKSFELYISVLLKSKIHIPTYAGLLRVSVSLILYTATRFSLKILLLTYFGLAVIFNSFLIKWNKVHQ